MFRVDKGRDATRCLRLRNHVQCERRFAAGFRAKHFNNTASGNPLAAQCQIERQAAGSDALNPT